MDPQLLAALKSLENEQDASNAAFSSAAGVEPEETEALPDSVPMAAPAVGYGRSFDAMPAAPQVAAADAIDVEGTNRKAQLADADERDRMAQLIRGIELGTKQLTGGISGTPTAALASPESTNYLAKLQATFDKQDATRKAEKAAQLAEQWRQRNYTQSEAKNALARADAEWRKIHSKTLSDETQRHNKAMEAIGIGHNKAMVDAAREGKTLPTTTVTGLADFTIAENSIKDLQKSFEENDMSGNVAKLESLAPDVVNKWLGTRVGRFNAQALIAMQNVGKIMEGGKLAAGDEAKYKSMLPQAGDNIDVARLKSKQASDFLRGLYDTQLQALKGSGYNTTGLMRGGATTGGAIKMKFPNGETYDIEPGDIADAKARGGVEL